MKASSGKADLHITTESTIHPANSVSLNFLIRDSGLHVLTPEKISTAGMVVNVLNVVKSEPDITAGTRTINK